MRWRGPSTTSHVTGGGPLPAGRGASPTGPAPVRSEAERASSPTVSPGRVGTAFTARITPGMNDVRS